MDTQLAPTPDYPASLLDERLRAVLPAPALRLLFTGPTGSGKSTVLAAVPVPDGLTRLVLDFEDSMAYLDAGPDGQDLYLPRRQSFRMHRLAFPSLSEVAEAFERLQAADSGVGALVIDNLSLLQDQIADLLQSGNARQVRNLFSRFDVAHYLPVDAIIARWAQQRDPSFWAALKLIPRRLLLTCLKHGIHFVASTEEGNLWKNYGKPTAEVIGKKANALKTWMQFTDAVIFLKRDPNTTLPPVGSINPLQPKMRIQGMNPSWIMDWPGFILELEAAAGRDVQPIPESAMVSADVISGEPELESVGADETPAASRKPETDAGRSRPRPAGRKSGGGPDWPTLFWSHVKTHDLNGRELLDHYNRDFEAACRDLGLVPNGVQMEPAA